MPMRVPRSTCAVGAKVQKEACEQVWVAVWDVGLGWGRWVGGGAGVGRLVHVPQTKCGAACGSVKRGLPPQNRNAVVTVSWWCGTAQHHNTAHP